MSSVPFLEVVRSGSTDYQTSQTEIVLVSHGHTLFRKRRKGAGNLCCSRLKHRNSFSHIAQVLIIIALRKRLAKTDKAAACGFTIVISY